MYTYMNERKNQRERNEYEWFENISTFNIIYADANFTAVLMVVTVQFTHFDL